MASIRHCFIQEAIASQVRELDLPFGGIQVHLNQYQLPEITDVECDNSSLYPVIFYNYLLFLTRKRGSRYRRSMRMKQNHGHGVSVLQ